MGRGWVLALLAAGLAGALLLGLALGPVAVEPGQILDVLLGRGEDRVRRLILDIRLPRVALAVVVGGALATAGAVFQALLRNPLADPYILGVSGGAAVGAVSVIVFGVTGVGWALTGGALLGAVLSMLLVLRIALSVGGALDTRVLLLAGVIVGAFFNAVILLLITFADAESFRSAVFWMMGSLAGTGWTGVIGLALFVVPCVLVLFVLARPFNVLATGEETATYLGVPVERVKGAAYFAASLLVAATVAVAGIIGFVGLIVPHAVRMLWGGDHRLLLPASFLGGAILLLLTDTLARTVAAPQELPTGVITALIGVPLFAVLLVRSSR
ncbi:MAG: FecCD family ABC transporter permease [Longimicrobiales bacterium]